MIDAPVFTALEREAIRREFMTRGASAASIHDGILVKRWATGPRKGEPKPVAAVQSMLDRGLVELADEGTIWLRAHFTDQGFQALKLLATAHRGLSPDEYGELLAEIAALPEDGEP